MVIPLLDVSWQHRQVRTEIDQALDRLLTDPNCDGTGFVAALEAHVANLLGAGVFAVGVQSGLAAEFLALKALGIGSGDEVITVPNSDVATTAAISHTGASFIMVDVDRHTHNIDPARIEAAITSRTRAILPVHMYGLPCDMDVIRAIARQHGLKVIEDATLALGGMYHGEMVGTLGDAAFFSFAPRKVIGGAGNGGMVVTRDPELAERVRLLKGYGQDPRYADAPIAQRQVHPGSHHLAEGHNLKLDGVQAAIIDAKLSRLNDWRDRRQAVADRYGERFAGVTGIEPPFVPRNVRHAWRNYVIRVHRRDHVRASLQGQGITASVLYIPPVHLQPVYRSLGLGPGSFPHAESLARELLCLPMYPGLTAQQVDEVAAALIGVVLSDDHDERVDRDRAGATARRLSSHESFAT